MGGKLRVVIGGSSHFAFVFVGGWMVVRIFSIFEGGLGFLFSGIFDDVEGFGVVPFRLLLLHE